MVSTVSALQGSRVRPLARHACVVRRAGAAPIALAILIAFWVAGCGATTPGATPHPTDAAPAAMTPTAVATVAPARLPTPTAVPIVRPTRPTAPAPSATPRPTATAAATDTPGPEPGVQAVVLQVYDGDTIEVEIDGVACSVRYIGIDAPEPGQGYLDFEWLGPEATEANRALVEGRTVRLESDVSDVDQYGRLLRYVWAGDVFVNAEMVRLGYAEARAYPPDVRYRELFERLQAEAQAAQRGIWAPRPTATPQPEIGGPECPYVGNANSNKFHHAACEWAPRIAPHNRVCLGSREEAIAQGYEPCGWCRP